ncbi:molybdenum cofactor guanylyltransferase [Paenibacillus silviterrae]|uniref:molybdenum cofactor guanylyltransferase n=1 Tax=Paenibacillus silviterrae TaxID=3242194 RepID=UPI0025428D81|nr:molybdenum cofactor guanylyltransferase [Paenibacillus chinjuensis]
MTTRDSKLSGVILAGGLNSRMGGRSKALLSYQGRTFLEHQLVVMRSCCQELLLITNEPDRHKSVLPKHFNVTLIPDRQPGLGPLGGMQAALHAAKNDTLWVAACDMPFISAAAALALAGLLEEDSWDAAVPRLHGRVQPLHGLYRRRCLPSVERQLQAEDLRLMRLLDKLCTAYADEAFFETRQIGLDFARNVNDPAAYEQLLQGR